MEAKEGGKNRLVLAGPDVQGSAGCRFDPAGADLSGRVRPRTDYRAGDRLDNSYSPKPEWNFLFLYEALKAFKGSWEWIGTVVIPTLLVLLLFAVPFIDRNEKKNPFQRPIAMLSGFMFVAVILVMTFIGYYSGSSGNAPHSASTNQTAAASASGATPQRPRQHPPFPRIRGRLP